MAGDIGRVYRYQKGEGQGAFDRDSESPLHAVLSVYVYMKFVCIFIFMGDLLRDVRGSFMKQKGSPRAPLFAT